MSASKKRVQPPEKPGAANSAKKSRIPHEHVAEMQGRMERSHQHSTSTPPRVKKIQTDYLAAWTEAKAANSAKPSPLFTHLAFWQDYDPQIRPPRSTAQSLVKNGVRRNVGKPHTLTIEQEQEIIRRINRIRDTHGAGALTNEVICCEAKDVARHPLPQESIPRDSVKIFARVNSIGAILTRSVKYAHGLYF